MNEMFRTSYDPSKGIMTIKQGSDIVLEIKIALNDYNNFYKLQEYIIKMTLQLRKVTFQIETIKNILET